MTTGLHGSGFTGPEGATELSPAHRPLPWWMRVRQVFTFGPKTPDWFTDDRSAWEDRAVSIHAQRCVCGGYEASDIRRAKAEMGGVS